MKIRPLCAELFHADGQTDITKVSVAFRHFANAPSPPPKKKLIVFPAQYVYVFCVIIAVTSDYFSIQH